MRSVTDILEKIQELTEMSKLRWEQDNFAARPVFILDFGNNRLRVWDWTDENDGSSGVSIQLTRGANYDQVIDFVSANEFNANFEKYNGFLGVARRSALNVDSAISEIEQQLQSLSRKD